MCVFAVLNVDVQVVADPNNNSVAVHWPVSQGTYLRQMGIDAGAGSAGVFGEAGSGGIMSDCAIANGDYGMSFGNQQWTFRDVSIQGSRVVGIKILWDWVFTFVGLSISNVPIGISWPLGAASMILIDSNFTNVVQAISEGVPGNGFFLFERVTTTNVTTMLTSTNTTAAAPFYTSWAHGPVLEGGKLISGNFTGELPPSDKPATPLVRKPRPAFGATAMPVSIMAFGAKADGVTDDSGALMKAIAAHDEVLLPHGTYLIAQTVMLRASTTLCARMLNTGGRE